MLVHKIFKRFRKNVDIFESTREVNPKNKLYFKIKSENFTKIDDSKIDLKVKVKNKYILKEFQIIDQSSSFHAIKVQ